MTAATPSATGDRPSRPLPESPRRPVSRRAGSAAALPLAVFGLFAALAGCGSSTAPSDASLPVATASVEIITLASSNPDSTYHATCQTGAIVRLGATGSHDPQGQALRSE